MTNWRLDESSPMIYLLAWVARYAGLEGKTPVVFRDSDHDAVPVPILARATGIESALILEAAKHVPKATDPPGMFEYRGELTNWESAQCIAVAALPEVLLRLKFQRRTKHPRPDLALLQKLASEALLEMASSDAEETKGPNIAN